jgi:hypothetical protein
LLGRDPAQLRRAGAKLIVENQVHGARRWFWPHTSLLRGPAAYRAASSWRPSMAVLATVAIVGLSFAGAAVLANFAGEQGLGRPRRGPDPTAGSLRVFAIWQVLVVILTLLLSTFFRGRIRDVLALHRPVGGWRAYAGAIAGLVVLQLCLAGAQHIIMRHDMLTDLRPFIDLARGPDWLVAAAVVGIGAPLSEELLFRGFLLSALARTALGFWGAATISTLLWTAMHIGYSLTGILEVFLIGMFFCWLLWRTGSLRVAVFCHALYNSFIVFALRFVDLPV